MRISDWSSDVCSSDLLFAHTRRRADKAEINTMIFDLKPDVILGGGSAYFLPQSTAGSKRKDDIDHIAAYQEAGYTLATTAGELAAASGSNTGKVTGLFHTHIRRASCRERMCQYG